MESFKLYTIETAIIEKTLSQFHHIQHQTQSSPLDTEVLQELPCSNNVSTEETFFKVVE